MKVEKESEDASNPRWRLHKSLSTQLTTHNRISIEIRGSKFFLGSKEIESQGKGK